MTKEQLQNVANEVWLGRLRVLKPKKNEQIGIPYKAWHHLAFIDNVVFTYVWDTREIIDAFMLGDVTYDFETIKVNDSGKALIIGADTTARAAKQARRLKELYPELPITDGQKFNLKTVKETTEEMLAEVDTSVFDIHDDAQIVFVDKSIALPDDLLMFKEMTTVNPAKRKFADNNSYSGIAKYFAIQARCAILRDWNNLQNNQTV